MGRAPGACVCVTLDMGCVCQACCVCHSGYRLCVRPGVRVSVMLGARHGVCVLLCVWVVCARHNAVYHSGHGVVCSAWCVCVTICMGCVLHAAVCYFGIVYTACCFVLLWLWIVCIGLGMEFVLCMFCVALHVDLYSAWCVLSWVWTVYVSCCHV